MYEGKFLIGSLICIIKVIPLVFRFTLTIKLTGQWKRVCMSIRMMTHLDPSWAAAVLSVTCFVARKVSEMLDV